MKITKRITATTYTLKLSEDEAQFLQDVCDRIGGCTVKSRRRIADRLRKTLNSVGVKRREVNDIKQGVSLYFTETKN